MVNIAAAQHGPRCLRAREPATFKGRLCPRCRGPELGLDRSRAAVLHAQPGLVRRMASGTRRCLRALTSPKARDAEGDTNGRMPHPGELPLRNEHALGGTTTNLSSARPRPTALRPSVQALDSRARARSNTILICAKALDSGHRFIVPFRLKSANEPPTRPPSTAAPPSCKINCIAAL